MRLDLFFHVLDGLPLILGLNNLPLINGQDHGPALHQNPPHKHKILLLHRRQSI